MKRDRQTVDLRHAEMLSFIRKRQEVKVEELAKSFGVSLMTVRRDLHMLEARGQISRTHGGATADMRPSPVLDEQDEVALYRRLIAAHAASFVRSGEKIFINGSSTALDLLTYTGDKSVRVFTNNGLAVTRRFPVGVEVTVSGGSLRGQNHIMTGDCALRNLLAEQTDAAFLGCSGISPDGEILCGIPNELGLNETMISHAERYYILADYTKIGKTGTYASFSLEKPGCVVTDERANPFVVERLRSVGMDVIQVCRTDYPDLAASADQK